MYVVDASVWVSRFVPADVFHQPSRLWLARQVGHEETIVAPALVLAEVAGAVPDGQDNLSWVLVPQLSCNGSL